MSCHRTALVCTFVAVIMAPPTLAFADDGDSVSIIVRESRQALSATTMTRSGLQAKRAATSDTARLLADAPGVSLQGAGGVSSLPVIHGLADDRLRVKVDDMDLIAACPNHMNPALSYIAPGQVELIQVYAGVTPVSVGGDSIGGSIVVKSAVPQFARPGQDPLLQGELGVLYRSNGDASDINLAAAYASDRFNISYTGAVAKSGNYEAGGDFKQNIYGSSSASPTLTGRAGHTLALDEVGSTAYETRNHTLGFAFKGGEHLVEAKFGYQDLPYQLYPNQRMDMLANKQNRLNLRYLGGFERGMLEARLYREQVDHFMDFGQDKRYWYGVGSGGAMAANGAACAPTGTMQCANGMPMYTDSKNTGLVLRTEINLSGRDLLRAGVELQQYTLNDWWPPSGGKMQPNTFWNINKGERDRSALYGEWETHPQAQWSNLFGVRYEQVRMNSGPVQAYNDALAPATMLTPAFNNSDRARRDDNWDLTAAASYSPNASFTVEFGFARKTRSPNLHERYAWFSRGMEMLMVNWFGDGSGYIGDRNLRPERAHTLSAAFDWHAADRSWEFKATPYYSRVSDYIDAVRCPAALGGSCAAQTAGGGKFVYLQFANRPARLYGIDLAGKLPLADTAWGAFGLHGLVNYSNGKNRSSGDNLYNIMPLNAKLTLTHQYDGWENALEIVLVDDKDNVSAVRNELTTPDYQLVNIRSSHAWGKVRVDFGVDNLFDRLYYHPLGGAYVGQGTTMTANSNATGSVPAWGVAVPGMGRSIYAGVNISF